MKFLLTLLFFAAVSFCNAQEGAYNFTQQDTFKLSDLKLRSAVALRLEEATILIDRNFFFNKLAKERKGLQKQIKSRERMTKKGNDYSGITSSQLNLYQKQYTQVDSVFRAMLSHKSDTFKLNYSVFAKSGSPFGDFLPVLIETGKCIITNIKGEPQPYIIRKTGNIKTGQMTGAGSSFYFVPGSFRHFWSKMNWVS